MIFYENTITHKHLITTLGMATLLKLCELIAWDECSMGHKKSFEALDRTLRDFNGIDKPMGRKLILLTGDL